jgi:predicted nucleic acid-binding Zn ribbon protein
MASQVKPRSLGDVLGELVGALGIQTQLKRHEVVNLWEEVAGERIAQVAKAREVRDGKLFVEVASSAWRNELFYLKYELVKKLNSRAGEQVIHDIVFV